MNALVTRRSLLLTAAAAAAAGTAGAMVHLPRAADGFRILSRREAAVVEALAAVLFPPGIFPVHGGDGGTAPMVDQVLSSALPPAAVPPFRYVLRAIQTGTLIARGRHFSDLPPDEAREVVSVWAGDDPMPRRLASDSVRFVLGTAFLRRPEVKAAIGFRAECLDPSLPGAPDLPPVEGE
ncbi:MAG: hypothetical protein H6742_05380 [Alphaproteobacteria bacterium]|nr:hypothetical protein [Alphaproteobacteria bacterium]